MPLDPSELNPTDVAILDELREGRCTPAYIAEKHGYSSGNVRNRMTHLASHDHVEGIGGGVYELIDDPRKDVEPTPDVATPQERIDDLEASLTEAREDRQAYKERFEECRDRLAEAPDRQELARAIDHLEASLANSGVDIDVAIHRLREVAGVIDDE